MVRGKLKLAENSRIQEFGIFKTETKISIKQMVTYPEQFLVNDIIQRELCWDNKRKSLLIHSIVMGIPVPGLHFQTLSRNRHNVIDGKQRYSTVTEYVSNNFPLHKATPPISVVYEDGTTEDIIVAGKRFKHLPEQFQDKILSFHFDVTVMDMDDNIKAIVFDRLNNNKPLRQVEKIRASMDFDFLEWLGKTKQLPLFNYGESDNNNKKNEDILLQTVILLRYNGDTGIGSKEIQFLANSGLSEDEKDNIEKVIKYASEAIECMDIAFSKRILVKINKTSGFIFIAAYAMELITPERYAEWAIKFFAEENRMYDEFRQYAESGSGKRDRVQKRLQIAKEDLMRYINVSAD